MKLFQAWMREADLSTNEVAAYNSQLLIVGMSATALESEQEAAFDYGMHFFCPKPTRMDVLGLMLEAKRLCATNEEALDMICENTGTNYCVSSPVGDEEEEGEGEGEGAANALDSQQLQEGDDRDASRKSSTKGSEKGSSGKIAALDAVAGSATDTAPPHTSASANTITTCSSGGAAVVSFASPTTTQGSQQLQSLPQSTAVTDSKSAAMWSVFRSYRQSRRNVVGSNASFAAIVAAESENEASS